MSDLILFLAAIKLPFKCTNIFVAIRTMYLPVIQ